jgi:glutathione peroxidase
VAKRYQLQLMLACAALLAWHADARADQTKGKNVPPVLSHTLKDIVGRPVDLAKYRGKVLLVVNVASECGYTGQYKGLQALHAKYAKDGLAVLGFPCNDFGQQEPGSNEKVKEFAKKTYGVEFDLFSKVKVLGKDASPLFRELTDKQKNPKCGGDVRWNVEKFLVGRDGRMSARVASDVEPESRDLLDMLEEALRK